MIYKKAPRAVRSCLLIFIPILLSFFLASHAAAQEADSVAPDESLNETDLQSLESTLSELKVLAPQLRVQLRTLRKQAGFDPRQIHLIERGMGHSQKSLERLIAMTKRNAFNGMRAHFLADDLRRKSKGLKDSLAYVQGRIQELNGSSNGRQADAAQQQSDEILMDLLSRYSDLVNDSVEFLKGKGI